MAGGWGWRTEPQQQEYHTFTSCRFALLLRCMLVNPIHIAQAWRPVERAWQTVKERISSLTLELELAQAALRKVAQVPWDELDEQVRIWARHVREASYDMEDVLDTFLVRFQAGRPRSVSAEDQKSFLKPLKKMADLFKKSKARRKISGDVKDIVSHLQEVTERCRRYKVDDVVARPITASTVVDPRLHAMFTQADKLVGIDESRGELKSKLKLGDMSSVTKVKTVSVVGIGGLGKTTLAKAVYDNIRGDFRCRAFVPVGRNPDLKRVLQMILVELGGDRYDRVDFAVLQDITQFIEKLREFLRDNKRYFIVIDDLWEKQSWETLKLAIPYDESCEGRIIITTRNWEVARNADEVYELPGLPHDSSRKLFYTRIYGDERDVDYQPEDVSDEILRKCAGVPLAIITMASLLVDEPRDKWYEVYKSIGFGCKENEEAENTMKKILSFSYYDLPSHLRTCLLYLSAFPEDVVIPKFPLVWMWVAEGFVQKQRGKGLFEIGEGYFNDLINRSLIQEVEPGYDKNRIHGCRVHDMVLDFIRSMSQEENFFTLFDSTNSDQGGALVGSNVVRRLAVHRVLSMSQEEDFFTQFVSTNSHHGGALVGSNVIRRLPLHHNIMGHSNQINWSKVRSFVALDQFYLIGTWPPLSSFKLVRVLNIYYDCLDDESDRFEHLGHLLHLRFLSINDGDIQKIPKEIGALKMLQTLDLMTSYVMELPFSSSLPAQLVCLRIRLSPRASDSDLFSVGSLTSLEDLSIEFSDQNNKASRRLLKELGNLTELLAAGEGDRR